MKRFYERNIEQYMINFYDRLSEKTRRRYAAVGVQKLGYGGQKYMSRLLGCDEIFYVIKLKFRMLKRNIMFDNFSINGIIE